MMLRNGFYHWENQKIHLKFQHLIEADLIPMADILTRGLAQYHIEQALVCRLPWQLLVLH